MYHICFFYSVQLALPTYHQINFLLTFRANSFFCLIPLITSKSPFWLFCNAISYLSFISQGWFFLSSFHPSVLLLCFTHGELSVLSSTLLYIVRINYTSSHVLSSYSIIPSQIFFFIFLVHLSLLILSHVVDTSLYNDQ